MKKVCRRSSDLGILSIFLGFSFSFPVTPPLLSSIFSFTRVCGFHGASYRSVSKGGAFLLLVSPPPLSSFFLFSTLDTVTSFLPFYPPKQHYLIIERMILLSARMARPAEHTFHFVNVCP